MKNFVVGVILLMLFCIFPLAISQSVITSYVFAGGVHEGDCSIWHSISGSFRMVPETCPSPVLLGSTASISGGLLAVAACTSGTASVTGATTSMVAVASPKTYPGDGVIWKAYVSSANVVTVKLCALIAITPTASIYNVRVIQ